jgi:acyl-CoA thioester hydrolase
MPYFDAARVEFHRHLGRMRVRDADFAMRASHVEYHAPARFDDLLEVFVRVERVGTTSITYEHAAYRVEEDGSDLLMATATQTLVLLDLERRRPVSVPDSLRDLIARFQDAPA